MSESPADPIGAQVEELLTPFKELCESWRRNGDSWRADLPHEAANMRRCSRELAKTWTIHRELLTRLLTAHAQRERDLLNAAEIAASQKLHQAEAQLAEAERLREEAENRAAIWEDAAAKTGKLVYEAERQLQEREKYWADKVVRAASAAETAERQREELKTAFTTFWTRLEAAAQKDLPPEAARILSENLWDLYE